MRFVKLNSICTFKQWKTLPIKELLPIGYPVYGANGIIGYSSSYNHTTPTLMICCRGATCGAINASFGKCYINGNAMALDNLSSEFDFDYVRMFLKHFDFSEIVTGAAQPQITQIGLSTIQIPKPSLEQQRHISKQLLHFETLINVKYTELSDLDSLVKSRFMEMFGEKYETKPLNEVCEELFAGGDAKKDKSSNVKSDKYPYPIYTNGEKDDGLYGYTSLMRVAKEAVTISGRGTIGFTCLRKEPFYPAVRLIVAVPNQELINGCYLQHFIESKNYGGQGASIPQLTVPMIKNELIPIPPISVQNEFKQFVKLIDKSRFVVQKEIKDLQELLDSKMDEYFGGEE